MVNTPNPQGRFVFSYFVKYFINQIFENPNKIVPQFYRTTELRKKDMPYGLRFQISEEEEIEWAKLN